MPDISMCAGEVCPLAETCYRSPKSGTKPSEHRQSYFIGPEEGIGCPYYWPTEGLKQGRRNND